MTKTHYALVGLLVVGSGVGVAVGVRLAERDRQIAHLRPQAALLAEVQQENLVLRKRLAETVPAAAPTSAAPITSATPKPTAQAPRAAIASRNIVDELVKVEDVTHQGAATPADAFQTIVWAAMKGNTDALAAVLALDPDAVEAGESFLRQLAPEQRATYKTAHHLVALITEKEVLEKGSKMLILETKFTGENSAKVSVLLADTDKGRKHPYVKEIHLVRTNNGWGLPIRREVVEGTIKRIRDGNL